jgi:hypothetical protein
VAQVSRPFQIALGAVVVLGLIWAVALHAHGSNPSEPVPTGPSAGAPSSGTAAKKNDPAAPTHIYHGAAPGVEGLTRAIAKAHGAVASSQRNAQQLERKSSEAAQEPQTSSKSQAPVAAAKATGNAAAVRQKSIETAALSRKTATRVRERAGSPSKSAHHGRSAAQLQVEGELSHGKTVMLVFWDPKSAVDQEVQAQAAVLAGHSKGAVTLHSALANQVGIFGSITEVVHVYQTPTILIVNRHGVVSTLTGLTDVFALEQAVREARSATR